MVEPLERLTLGYSVADFTMSRGTRHSTLETALGGGPRFSGGSWSAAGPLRATGPLRFPGRTRPTPTMRFPDCEVVTVPRHVNSQHVEVLMDAGIDGLRAGPTETRRRASRFTIVAKATGIDGRGAHGEMYGGDIYRSTATGCAEGIRRLCAGGAPAGVQAPSQAYEVADFLEFLGTIGLPMERDPRVRATESRRGVRTDRRQLLLTGVAGLVTGLGSGCGRRLASGQPAPVDLDGAIARLSDGASPDQDYRPPTAEERQAALAAVDGLLAGDLMPALVGQFHDLGFDAVNRTDAATGRPYQLAVSRTGTDRAWGAVALDRGARPGVLVEVPHLRSDRHTEDIGLALFRAIPGAALLVASAHRRADHERADVAHRTDSLFHAIAGHLGDRGLPELQLHGFDDTSLPDVDAVVSPGAGEVSRLAEWTVWGLSEARFSVRTAWSGDDCGALEGRTNVQGRTAAAAARPFVHIELSARVRDDDRLRAITTRALARAVRGASDGRATTRHQDGQESTVRREAKACRQAFTGAAGDVAADAAGTGPPSDQTAG